MLKISTLDEQDVLDINPREVRVRITLDEPAEIDASKVRLVFKFEHQQNIKSEYQYFLKLLTSHHLPAESGLFSNTPASNQYEFRLTNQSIKEFQKYQREFIKKGKPQKYKWRVYYILNQKITKDMQLTLDVELKFANNEEYFYLLKDAKLAVESVP